MPSPIMPDDVLERRFVEATQLRVVRAGDNLQPQFSGYAIVFNKLSLNLGGFRERIAAEALDRTFRENVDVRALLDHNPAQILGRLSADTLRLKPDKYGLRVEIDAPNTSYARDALESVSRRDISGMSFGFRAFDDEWTDEDEMPIRTVTDMVVREVSIVTFPAYTDTDVEVAHRSMERWRSAPRPYHPSLAMNRARQRQAEQ
jgi:HK97 family phage prohead protease